MTTPRRRLAPYPDIYGIPSVLGIVTAAGLTSALLGDGVWDLLSCTLLAVPLAVVGRGLVRSTRNKAR
jgi:hypothetical protein